MPERFRVQHVGQRDEFWSLPHRRPIGAGPALVGRHRDGHEIPVEISLSPLEFGDEPLVFGVVRDNRERRRADEELRASQARFAGILAIAEDAIVSVNTDQRIILFNQGAEKIFGYTAAEVLGRPLDLLLPPRFVADHGRDMAEFARSGSVARRMGERSAVFGRRKDGTEFPAEASISKLELHGETVFTAMLRDVTKRKRVEAAIHQLNEELEQRVRERTSELAQSNRQLAHKNEENETFVYSVSHDLRSPLVNLEGFSKELHLVSQDLRTLLTDNHLPAEVQQRSLSLLDGDMAESIRYIQTAVARLSGIIDALLRLSRAGRVQYQWRPVALNAVVARVVQALRGTIVERGASVTVADVPDAWGDETALEQIFANLIGNALNYLDPARPGVIVVGSVPGTGERTTYFVKDNGRGIPASSRDKVFRAFQRLHPDAARGEGMGLTIVSRVVERHGGRVWFESGVGQGTTFFVTLPAREGPASGVS